MQLEKKSSIDLSSPSTSKPLLGKEVLFISFAVPIMAEMEEKRCSNLGCDQPGTSACGACKTTFYCSVNCQTADWTRHKEDCQGQLRKLGTANLQKAVDFHEQNNWAQTLRYSDLALTKLKRLKDRPIELLSTAMKKKFDALNFTNRKREALECAREWYCLWNTKCTDRPALDAAFALIESCLHNNEFSDAVLYASTLWEIINHKYDNKIPEDERPQYIARGAKYLAQATWQVLIYLSHTPTNAIHYINLIFS